MIKSKGWDWNVVDEQVKRIWRTPAVESYYLLNRWSGQRKKRFLDLGCGLGRHSILFGSHGFDVSCFDISEAAIQATRAWAQELNLSFDYKLGDMLSLPYAKDSFDCVYCRHVMSHTDTEGAKIIISELKRVMRSGAECYLTLSSKDGWSYKNWPIFDQNTRLCPDEGAEHNVPHFYVDYGLATELLSDFEIIEIKQEIEYYQKNGKDMSNHHFHVLIKKN